MFSKVCGSMAAAGVTVMQPAYAIAARPRKGQVSAIARGRAGLRLCHAADFRYSPRCDGSSIYPHALMGI